MPDDDEYDGNLTSDDDESPRVRIICKLLDSSKGDKTPDKKKANQETINESRDIASGKKNSKRTIDRIEFVQSSHKKSASKIDVSKTPKSPMLKSPFQEQKTSNDEESSALFKIPLKQSKDQFELSIRQLTDQLKLEKQKNAFLEEELRTIKTDQKLKVWRQSEMIIALEKEIEGLKVEIEEARVAKKNFQSQLLHLNETFDSKLKAFSKEASKKSNERVKELEFIVESLRNELRETKLSLERVKSEKLESDKRLNKSQKLVKEIQTSRFDDSRITAEKRYGQHKCYNSSDDEEQPRVMDCDRTFEYTPQKPSCFDSLELISPELSHKKPEREDSHVKKASPQQLKNSPQQAHKMPLKSSKTGQGSSSNHKEEIPEYEELAKIKAENKKLHEQLRKLLNGRPSNLSLSSSPVISKQHSPNSRQSNYHIMSKEPLGTRHKPPPVDLESATYAMLSVNPTLNVVAINDNTVEVNRRRLTLMVDKEGVLCVKIKEKLVDLREFIASQWPRAK